MLAEFEKTRLSKILQPLKGYVAAAGFFSAFINILMLVPAIYMLQVYDRAVGSQSTSTLGMLTLIMVGLLIAMGGLEWVRSQITARAAVRFDELMAEKVFDATFRQSLATGSRSGTQALTDFSGIRNFIASPAVNAFFDTPWIPIYILIMFAFHSYFGLMAIGSVALLGMLTWLNQRSTAEEVNAASKEQMWTNNYANRHLRNAEVIESMGMMPDVYNRWAEHNKQIVNLQDSAATISGRFSSASKSLRIMLQSLALGLGAYLAINLEISAGMMIAGSILLGRALAPVDQMVGSWKGFQNARQQFWRLEELLSARGETQEKMNLPEPRGELIVEGIRVAPPGVKMPVIKGVSFKMNAGTTLGIIGPSAAGKSTLARAILGLWPALMGAVRLDGADIARWDRKALGPYIGYLPQDIELFDGTIAENIARFGDVDSQAVVAAAKLAGVHEMVLRLPQGYDTVIGVSEGALSAGQRQRIGLARAVYGDPKLLVLDEPNSNLDESGEQALRSALTALKEKGATVIVITHRPNILAAVDRIMILRDGAVADIGPTASILQKFQQAAQQRQPGGASS